MKIELKNMSKNFGKQVIFDKFDLEINSGEIVAVMGKSGSGKTTLINILGLIENVGGGKILYDNQPVTTERQKRKLLSEKIGFVFQNFGLIDNETIFDNLALVKQLQSKKAKDKHLLIKQALENVGLSDDFIGKKVFECSGGEQQRVAIAKILLKDCSVIFADEPTASLDTDNKKTVLSHLKKLHSSGKTVVIVSHDYGIGAYCDRVITI
ncbi:MAG: ABC transporter ATP-binding protein [Lachnospiraceae bacterium]|nr:ABC transporter ATP-binding protein [Lachnospiraceae bacterium]